MKQEIWQTLILVVLVGALVLRYTITPVEELAARYVLYDDAFYYLKIAENLVASGESSFDGINETNGYHPLWLLVLSGMRLSGTHGDGCVKLALLLEIGCYFLSVVLMYRLACKVLGQSSVGPLVAGILYGTSPYLLCVVGNGLETGLATLCLSAFLWSVAVARERCKVEQSRQVSVWLLTCVVLTATLMFLSRLDWVFVFGMCVAVLFFEAAWRKRTVPWNWLAVGGCVGLVVLTYMLTNQLYFGTPFPLSGQVKHKASLFGLLSWRTWPGAAESIAAIFWPLTFKFWTGSMWFVRGGVVVSVFAFIAAVRKTRDPILAVTILIIGWGHAIAYIGVQGPGPAYYFLPLTYSMCWGMGLASWAAPLWAMAAWLSGCVVWS